MKTITFLLSLFIYLNAFAAGPLPHGPTDAQIAKIASFPTGFLCDAMDGRGALAPDLGWLDVHSLPTRFCGVALTSDNGPDDLLGLMGSLGIAQAGDVMVASTGGWRSSAVAGDRVMGMMKNNGCVGFVTDGLVRDHEGLIEGPNQILEGQKVYSNCKYQ